MSKPSERIEAIRQELIAKDWVAFGGNRYSREMWQDKCNNDMGYAWRALLDYLDEDAGSGHPLSWLKRK